MLDRELIRLPKWPFLVGDVLLAALAGWLCYEVRPVTDWHLLAVVACVLTAAWMGVLPFVLEHRSRLRLAEVQGLATVTEQMEHLRGFSNQLSFATAQWQVVQDQADKSIESAKGLTNRIGAEAKAFTEFLQQANDGEKKQLKLELEKFRKGEVEWLQIVVRLLDHVHALHNAGVRSGQPRLVEQLGRFQHACRDTVRRAGLIPFEPSPDEPFNDQLHQLHNSDHKPGEGARIEQTLAPGFRYQGRILRPALVSVAGNGKSENVDVAVGPRTESPATEAEP
jgi:molecular chaperone GrpE (heat shock protein)